MSGREDFVASSQQRMREHMDSKFLKRIKRRDRVARWVISAGGMTVIASVLLILLLIVRVAVPLFQAPQAEVFSRFSLPPEVPAGDVLAVGLDEYLESAFTLSRDGSFAFFEVNRGELRERQSVEPPVPGAEVRSVENAGGNIYELLWSDGSLSLEQIRFQPQFDAESRRTIVFSHEQLVFFPPPAQGYPVRSLARLDGAGRQTRVNLFADNRLLVEQTEVSEDFLGNRSEKRHELWLEAAPAEAITALALDHQGYTLYAGTGSGILLRWDLEAAGSPVLLDRLQAFADRRAVTALGLVFGDISLAVGDDQGGLSTWFPVVGEGASRDKRLRRIHTLERHAGAVTTILPSRRDKSLLSLDRSGVLHLDHMTSERHLLNLGGSSPLQQFAFSARGNGIFAIDAAGQATLWSVDNPHPEVSLGTLFGRVWYEGYPAPAYVWQSSAATDDFEPKFSLTPLIFGTLKGTFYAMLFAVPLALLGAIYTSQFGSPRLRQWIKPTVETMAAIPSVVIGFLAALWLAPLVERNIAALFLSLALLPTTFVLALLAWQGVRRIEPLRRLERGFEFLALAPVLVLAVAAAWVLGPMAESLLFAGDFRQWLFDTAGARYDQRNCIIIAFALGFAVIPIIFTIAEDSLSNVPGSLKAASLALGASRWQTVWRVILPSASPGIFAGVMIGFGRAIGETMIVLMATGNTAIIDLSIFNGMRPLSSNIAVEIPEAPHGGSLYRILFFSAVLLFMLTFVLNTAAEIVRQRLRKKYGRF
jgi:phosphate transport system permease protein